MFEARRRSANCTKVTQKLKELMQHRSNVKNQDSTVDRRHAKPPLALSTNKSVFSLKPAVKSSLAGRPNQLAKQPLLDNKENISRELPAVEAQAKRDQNISRDKTPFLKTPVNRVHKKMQSMNSNSGILPDNVGSAQLAQMRGTARER